MRRHSRFYQNRQRIRAMLWCKLSPQIVLQGRPWDAMRWFDLVGHDANFDLDHGAGLVYAGAYLWLAALYSAGDW
uniref:Uncharacterized protein n=1 Tax=Triticum urartu TaxID=4572 RepID=A0A8R7USV7_TRIUA